jgi:hypothetical protein
MAIVADSADATEGVNVTLMVQVVPAAMLGPQVLDGDLKSAALVPLNAMSVLANGMGSEVLFFSVMVLGAEVTVIG